MYSIDIILTTYVHKYIGVFNVVLTNDILHFLLAYKAKVLTNVRHNSNTNNNK